jgi:hypothetical protein
MQQDLSTGAAAIAALIGLFSLAACRSTPTCRDLAGTWSNGEGQQLVFEPSGRARWLTRFGSSYDTVSFAFELDCRKKPAALDMKNFQGGPYIGRTLYAILEWTSDTSFRLRYEPGDDDSARPEAFDPEQTQRFVRRVEKG